MGLDLLTGRTKEQIAQELVILQGQDGLEESRRHEDRAREFLHRVNQLRLDYPTYTRIDSLYTWAQSEHRTASTRVRTKEGQITAALEKLRVSLEGEE